MDTRKKPYRHVTPMARLLSAVVSLSMVLSLVPSEGLTWAQQRVGEARAAAMLRADEGAGILTSSAVEEGEAQSDGQSAPSSSGEQPSPSVSEAAPEATSEPKAEAGSVPEDESATDAESAPQPDPKSKVTPAASEEPTASEVKLALRLQNATLAYGGREVRAENLVVPTGKSMEFSVHADDGYRVVRVTYQADGKEDEVATREDGTYVVEAERLKEGATLYVVTEAKSELQTESDDKAESESAPQPESEPQLEEQVEPKQPEPVWPEQPVEPVPSEDAGPKQPVESEESVESESVQSEQPVEAASSEDVESERPAIEDEQPIEEMKSDAEDAEDVKDAEDAKSEADAVVPEARNTRQTLVYEDAAVKVTATLTDPASLPEGVELVVTPVTAQTPAYDYGAYMDALNAASGAGTGVTHDEQNTLLYDVAFLTTDEDGKLIEVEPDDGSVTVNFEFKRGQLTDGLEATDASGVTVTHLPLADGIVDEAGTTARARDIAASDISVEPIDAQVTGDAATMVVDAFSIYAFSYTVDFTYDGYTYSIAGESEILLSELFAILGIDVSAADVASVEFTDESLVRVEKADEDWRLVSLRPFLSEEVLTATLKNGNKYVINVTDAPATHDLADYLYDATIDAPIGEDGTYKVSNGTNYNVHLYFRETRNQQFPNAGQMTYQLPDGLTGDGQSGSFSIIVRTKDGTVIVPGNSYSIRDGVLYFDWSTDPSIAEVFAANNTAFEIEFAGQFTKQNQRIIFSDKVEKDITVDNSSSVSATKVGSVDYHNGKVGYTVNVKSNGNSTNVAIADTITGTGLTLHEGSVSATSSTGRAVTINNLTYNGNTFTGTIPSMADGEIITLRYYADIDPLALSLIDGKAVTTARNEFKVHNDYDPSDKTVPVYNEIEYVPGITKSLTGKSAVGDDKEVLSWKITANPNPQVSYAGGKVTDTISAASRQYLKYSGDGITVTVKDASGATVRTYDVSWDELGVDTARAYTWSYTIPSTADDKSHAYSYEITYTTDADTSGLSAAVEVSNTSTNDGGKNGYGSGTIGPVIDTGTIKKEVNEVDLDHREVTWKATIEVPAAGLATAVVTDTYPSARIGERPDGMSIWAYDEVKEGTIEVEGELLDGEFYVVDYGATAATITFYKGGDKDHPETAIQGFAPSDTARTITVTLKTEIDEAWLEKSDVLTYLRTHTNRIALNSVQTSASVDITNTNISKSVTQDGVRTVDGVELPVYKYELLFYGVSGVDMTIDDKFDTSLLEPYVPTNPEHPDYPDYYTKKPFVMEGGTQYWIHVTKPGMEKDWAGNPAPAMVNYLATADGMQIFTNASNMPVQENGVPFSAYRLTYYLTVKDEAALKTILGRAAASPNGEYDITNEVDWRGRTDTSVIPYTYEGLNKELISSESELDPGLNKDIVARFRITLNPAAQMLNGGNPITMTDTYRNLSVLYDSVEVTPANAGVTYDFNESVGTYTIPDATAVTIEYSAQVIRSSDTTQVIHFENEATMLGYDDDADGDAHYTSDGHGTASQYSINLLKYEAGDMTKRLEGAEFQLYEGKFVSYDAEGNPIFEMTDPVTDKNGNPVIRTTDENGKVEIYGDQNADGWSLYGWADTDEDRDNVYYLKETKAPNGYLLTNFDYCFRISAEGATDYSTFLYHNGDTMSAKNYPGRDISVEKEWADGYTPSDEDFVEVTLQQKIGEDGTWSNTIRREVDDKWVEGELTLTLNKDNSWRGMFRGLPLVVPGGVNDSSSEDVPATYQIRETSINGMPADAKDTADAHEGQNDTFHWSYGGDDTEKTITNRSIVSESGAVKVTKAFSGVAALPDSFKITNSYNTAEFTVANKVGGSGTADDPYYWVIEELPVGTTVTFTEHGAQIDGCELTATAVPANYTSAAVVKGETQTVAITNTYKAGDADVTLKATKSLTGRDWVDGDSFAFQIEAIGESAEDAPMPSDAVIYATKTNQTVSWGTMKFSSEGTWTYKVTEPAGTADGITYSTQEYTVEVTVTDNKAGKLIPTVKVDDQVVEAGSDHAFEVGTFTNKFAKTTAELKATKSFNDWGKASSFEFNLQPGKNGKGAPASPMPEGATGDKVSRTVTESNKTAQFGTITFYKEGTYNYVITETKGDVDGVAYDASEHKVAVVVTRSADGDLSAVVKYFDSAGNEVTEDAALLGATITNTYADVSASIKATKVYNGDADWGKATGFDIKLTAGESSIRGEGGLRLISPMPEGAVDGTLVKQATKDAQTIDFGAITYEKAGTYEYTVQEVVPEDAHKVKGVTYDETAYRVVVTVDKDEDNALSASVTYYDAAGKALAGEDAANGTLVTNTYDDATAEIKATKAMKDWGTATSFEFNLEPVDGAPMPGGAERVTKTVTKDAPLARFGKITYYEVGDYAYTITETKGSADGVTYDATTHNVTVRVTKEDGKLRSEVVYAEEGAEAEKITNAYKKVKAHLEATKEFNDWGKAQSFTFELEPVDGAPMPSSSTAEATKDSKTAVFGDITFERTGTYKYRITEVNDGVDGVSYDVNPHYATVTVTKDANNKMSAAVTYDDGAADLTVTNTYADVKTELEATKAFNNWGKAESFDFKLEPVDGAPMPEGASEGAVTKRVTEENPTAKFGEISYEKAGVYKYTIQEVVPEDAQKVKGVTYDGEPHEAVVTVTKAEDATNALSATVKYEGADSLTITNTYDDASASIQVTKAFSDWGKAESFDFTLTPVGGAPMPADDAIASDGSLTKSATQRTPVAVFGTIEYTRAGDYQYKLQELNGGVDGVSYDTTEHVVVVNVAKNDKGKLVARTLYDAEYDEDKHAYSGAESLTVTNAYTSAKATIKAKKVYNGDAGWGKASSFTFTLDAATEGAPMPATTVVTATKDEPEVAWAELEFDHVGEYQYTITETDGHVPGVTYDTTSHEVTVKVTKAKDATNALTAKVVYSTEGAKAEEITNTYSSVKAHLEATKEFNDWGKAQSFTFKLEPVDGAPMPSSSTAEATKDNKTAVFGDITFEEPGTYQYRISEVIPKEKVAGVSYDTEAHAATVTVTADDQNQMHAVVTYGDGAEELVITNTFSAVTTHFEAAKAFNDWGKAESFTFTLAAADERNAAGVTSPMPAERTVVTVKEDTPEKKAIFGDITFETPGTYFYTITEANDGKPGVSYDTTPHVVKVEVHAGQKNELVADVTYDGEAALVVTNTFTDVKAHLEATKAFNDWGKAQSFTFDLTAQEARDSFGAPIEPADMPMPADTTATATESKNPAQFGEMTFEKPGTYVYTITERNDHADGVTYDTTAHTATVTVTKAKDASNALAATVTYDDGQGSLVITNTFQEARAQIKATKVYGVKDSKWGAEDKFNFELVPVDGAPLPSSALDGKLTATATAANKTAAFSEIAFDKAGTYAYYIQEVAGEKDYVTYDAARHAVTVTVAKDEATNALSATVKYEDAQDALTVTNGYDATGMLELSGITKKLNGRNLTDADVFTFELKDTKGNVVATGTNNTAGTITFNPATITYRLADLDRDGDGVDKETTFNYTLSEIVPDDEHKLGGVTYDEHEYPIAVTVKDSADHNGTLVVTPSKLDDLKPAIALTNTYDTRGRIVLSGTKTLQNRTLKEGEFIFELYEGDIEEGETPLRIATNAADGSYAFEELAYTGADLKRDASSNYVETTKRYTVVEKAGSDTSVKYDPKQCHVTVILNDDGKGTIVTEADHAVGSYDFKNTYDAAGFVDFEGTKAMDGRDFQAGDEYTFTVTGDTSKTPLPKNPSVTIRPTSGNTASMDFGRIDYKLSDLDGVDPDEDGVRTKEFTYTVTETGTVDGVALDAAKTVTVSVTDDGSGTLKVSEGDEEVRTVGVAFTNEFTAAKKALEVTKSIDDWGTAESFDFTLTPGTATYADGTTGTSPMPKTLGGDKATATPDATTVQFGEIEFERAGTYTYIINEVDGRVPGVTYDTSDKLATVTVVRDLSTNALSATVAYGEGEDSSDTLTITNSYASEKAALQVTKSINDWGEPARSFDFTLTAGSATYSGGKTGTSPMPAEAGGEASLTKTATKDSPTASFGEIEYRTTGVYNYTIKEAKGSLGGVTYDETVYDVVVTVSAERDGNGLDASVVYKQKDGTEGASLTVTNAYAATGKARLWAQKDLRGRVAKAGEFSFTLTGRNVGGAEHEDGSQTVAMAKNDDHNRTPFDAIKYDLDDMTKKPDGGYEDTAYVYTIREVVPEDADKLPGVTYDTTEAKVRVTLHDDGAGKITTTYENLTKGGDAAGYTFENVYRASGKLELSGHKAITDKPASMDLSGFKFTVREGDEVVATGESDADGRITFTEIAYADLSTVGEHAYAVTEDADSKHRRRQGHPHAGARRGRVERRLHRRGGLRQRLRRRGRLLLRGRLEEADGPRSERERVLLRREGGLLGHRCRQRRGRRGWLRVVRPQLRQLHARPGRDQG